MILTFTFNDLWILIAENWQLYGAVLLLIFVLAISGRLTRLLRDARNGLKDVFTLEGFIVTCVVGYIVYQILIELGVVT